jgi:hypothetical protein
VGEGSVFCVGLEHCSNYRMVVCVYRANSQTICPASCLLKGLPDGLSSELRLSLKSTVLRDRLVRKSKLGEAVVCVYRVSFQTVCPASCLWGSLPDCLSSELRSASPWVPKGGLEEAVVCAYKASFRTACPASCLWRQLPNCLFSELLSTASPWVREGGLED